MKFLPPKLALLLAAAALSWGSMANVMAQESTIRSFASPNRSSHMRFPCPRGEGIGVGGKWVGNRHQHLRLAQSALRHRKPLHRRLVYLDAFVPEDGKCLLDYVDAAVPERAARLAARPPARSRGAGP